MRAVLAALLATLTLGLAGCGSEDVGAGQGSAADLLKAGALVYWESASDPDSEQWKQAEELLRRFPDGEKWIRQLRQEFEQETDASWNEVEDALGETTAVAVYATSLTAGPTVVGLTNPDDPDATVALVKKLNASDDAADDAVTRVVDDWVVISDKPASIDAALKGDGAALGDDEGFKAAMEELPDDSLSRAYFDAAAALDVLGDADAGTSRQLRMLGLDKLDFAGGWAKAKEDGAELAFALRGEGVDRLLGTGDPYTSKLLDRVPGDAFAFLSFRGEAAKEQFEQLRSNPLYTMGIREVERELGVKIDEIVQLFDGEVAFYAAPGAPIPELTLLLDAADPAQARQSADRLLRTLTERAGGEVTEDGDVTTAVFPGFTINLGTTEGAVVLSTSKDAFGDGADGERLADSDRYKDALSAAGAPDEYTGLTWVDLSEAVELALGYASTSGEPIPPEVRRNLEPLQSLVAFGEKDGDIASSLVFVEIE